jgi:predicted small secreted protein
MARAASFILLIVLAAALLAACGGDDEQVGSDQIADGAVGTPQLAERAVTADKLGDDVTEALAEAGASLAASPVGTDRLEDGSVTTAKIAGGAVNSGKVEDESLTDADIDTSTLEDIDAALLNGQADYLRDVSIASRASPSNLTVNKGPVVASCPAGKTLLAGGASVVVASGARLLIAISASAPNGQNGWSASAFDAGQAGQAWSLEVFAVCATVAG